VATELAGRYFWLEEEERGRRKQHLLGLLPVDSSQERLRYGQATVKA
jgi:hypothetical protein